MKKKNVKHERSKKGIDATVTTNGTSIRCYLCNGFENGLTFYSMQGNIDSIFIETFDADGKFRPVTFTDGKFRPVTFTIDVDSE